MNIEKELKSTKWYHAAKRRYLESISKKIDVKINKDIQTDFGYGFYLSNVFEGVRSYIESYRKKQEFKLNGLADEIEDEGIIIEFEYDQLFEVFSEEKYNTTVFPFHDLDFALFVFENRYYIGEERNDFDAVFGVQSHKFPVEMIDEFKTGQIKLGEVFLQLMEEGGFNQLVLRNPTLCDRLKLTKVYWSKSGEELLW